MNITVIKVGSSTLVAPDGRLRETVLAARVEELAALVDAGEHPILVSSGAVACGLGRLGIDDRPTALADLQAASAVGQGVLFQRYSELFTPHRVVPAQVLLSSADFANRASYLNARTTLRRLLELGTVPIINENDTTATDELTFGDNDVLAAQVAILMGARLLLLLTDRDGLYGPGVDGEPQLLGAIPPDTSPDSVALADLSGSGMGRGGITSKIAAAAMAVGGGVACTIASGRDDGVIPAAVADGAVGTRFAANRRHESSFKLWLRHARTVRGDVEVDAGAASALRERGTSLLAVGVLGCAGSFQPGDAVRVVEMPGRVVVGKGIVRLSNDELRAVAGMKSEAVRTYYPETATPVIHRDEFVLVGPKKSTRRGSAATGSPSDANGRG